MQYSKQMMIRHIIICKVLGCKPLRRRAWWDNLHWRSNCKYCHTPVIRDHHGWREFGPNDFSIARCSKDEAILREKQSRLTFGQKDNAHTPVVIADSITSSEAAALPPGLHDNGASVHQCENHPLADTAHCRGSGKVCSIELVKERRGWRVLLSLI